MKRILYGTMILCFLNAYSQRPDFEALKKAVTEAETEDARIRALTEYGDALPNNQHAEVMSLADSIELMAEMSNNSDYPHASSTFLRGVSYYKARDYEKCIPMLASSYQQFHSLNDPYQFRSLNILGLSYLRIRKIDSAIYTFNTILETIPNDNIKGIVSAHGNIGIAYRQSGAYGKAIQHYQKVYELDSSNSFTRINTSMNIARMYNDMEMHDKAIETLKAITLKDIPPIPPKAVYYNNLGNSFADNENLDSAYKYFKIGLTLSEEINYESGAFTAISNLIEYHLKLEQFDSIPELISQLTSKQHSRPEDGAFRIHFLTGQYHLKANHPAEAIEAFLLAEKEINNPVISRMKSAVFNGLIDAYNLHNNSIKAKEYIDKLDKERESPQNSRRDRFLAEAKANYLLANTENELQETLQEKEFFSTQRLLFASLAIISLMVAFILFRYYRRSTQTLKSEQEEKISLEKEIEKQRTQIIELKSKAVIDTQEIVSIKSDGHYLEFSLRNQNNPEVDRNSIKDIIELLPDYFIQIHRSYIINLKEVRVKYADHVEMKNGQELPISRKFKPEVNIALKRFNN